MHPPKAPKRKESSVSESEDDRNSGKVEVYGAEDEWYWRRRANNGQITSIGGESYTRKFDCIEAAKNMNPGYEIIEA